MPVDIPKISNRFCVGITACGRLTNDDGKLLGKIKKLQKEKREFVAEYPKGKSVTFVRLEWGGNNSKHIHVDVYRKKALGKAVPQVNSTIEDIQDQLNYVVGEEAKENLLGRFKFPVKSLPGNGLIASTFFVTGKGNRSIRMTAGELTIEGSPVQRLTWKLDDKMDYIFIELSSTVLLKITDDYLLDIYQVFDSAFRVLVLGDGSNDGK